MLMLTRQEKFLITFVAGGIVLAGGIILLVSFLNGKFQSFEKPEKPVAQEEVEELPALLPDPPLVTYTEGFPEGMSEDDDTWKLLYTGDGLDQGSVVRTDEESSMDIRIRPGTVVRIMEETLFSLDSLNTEKIGMNVESGMLISRVKKLSGDECFEFKTPSAVAGIRGTELVISVTPENSVVYGMSGTIEVYSPESPENKVLLGLHQKTNVKKGAGPAEAVPMSPEEIELFRKQLDSLRENQVFLVGDKITFQPNSVELTPEAKEEIEGIYEQLQAVRGKIKIVGHTADIGDKSAQIDISTRRARSVMEYLVELGMTSSKLSALGMGSRQPVSDEPSLMHRNRRVEFVIESE